MDAAIRVHDLRRTFRVPERAAGLRASVQSLVRRRYRTVTAVDGVSFSIAHGEIVGFLGPNGAGKTTTLKMLAGLLHPTSGEARVLDFVPHRRESLFLHRIALLMGNRDQLVWDLPVVDSFTVNREIYRIPPDDYRRTLDELIDLLDLGPLLGKPVRTLSLGERMKCEIAAALLHGPRVLFLDEPTIGLDVTTQRRLRAFVRSHNQSRGTTVLLTSHAMLDIAALCRRVIVVHHGRLLYDGALTDLVERFTSRRIVVIDLAEGADAESADLGKFGQVVSVEDSRVTLSVPKRQAFEVIGRLVASTPIVDLTVTDPPLDEVIDEVFTAGAPREETAGG